MKLSGIHIFNHFICCAFPKPVYKGVVVFVAQNNFDETFHNVGKTSHGNHQGMSGRTGGRAEFQKGLGRPQSSLCPFQKVSSIRSQDHTPSGAFKKHSSGCALQFLNDFSKVGLRDIQSLCGPVDGAETGSCDKVRKML